MGKAELWYHDLNEVDPMHSWLKNSPSLISSCDRKHYDECSYSKVLALVEYTRPDFILTIDGEPLLSVELTTEVPTGHNLPQRYACLLRAAELGVPSIYYYPEYSRKTTGVSSKPLYLNVRTPLAQLRMGKIFDVPSLSMFWPTDPATNFPTSDITKHAQLARLVEYTKKLYDTTGGKLKLSDPEVVKITKQMEEKSVPVRPSSYVRNTSYRAVFPEGNVFTSEIAGKSIDPPPSCRIETTKNLLSTLYLALGKRMPKSTNSRLNRILSRENTFVYKGTCTKNKTGPEHPYPGYLTLLDILYLRKENGQTTRDRIMNLAFELPMQLEVFRENAFNRPTGLNIIMEFADLIILEDAIVLGGWMRNVSAGAVLVKK